MKNSGKISWFVAIIATMAVLLLLGAYSYVKFNGQKQAKVLAYGSLVAVVENFHSQFKEDLSPSVTGKAALQDQLRKMKIMAETYTETVQELEVKAGTSGDTASLGIAIDKVDKYLKGYKELANLSIQKESLQTKAKAMTEVLREVAQTVGSTKTLDEGEVNEVIARGVKITVAYDKACKPAPVATTTVVVTGTPYYRQYWSNPEYGDYYRTIQRIVAQYSAGRSALNSCLTHYDNHSFSSYDSTVWSREVNRRQQLLNDLSNIYGEIPSGSVYAEHHRLLEGMISSALTAMRIFANNQNDYNRSELSRVSTNNTRTMMTLKRFYGIR